MFSTEAACSKINGKLRWMTPCVVIGIIVLVLVGSVLLGYFTGRKTAMMKRREGYRTATNVGAHAGPYPDVFTMYKADWCPHCQKCKPEWDKMEQNLQAKGVPVTTKVVDADASKTEVKEAGVEAFPTMIMTTSDGSKNTYKGPRKAAEMEKWVEGMISK